ncbi:VanZ family protein [Azospira inquinata]|nr:VanZ family protein [Azospira inquinata]
MSRPNTPSTLPRYLALAYGLLVIYASLHPFSGWRSTGASPFAYLNAAWPRYWTVFDLAVNVAGYLPLGFLLALALKQLPTRALPALAAWVMGTALSFAMESIQTWLPSRVPSNLDLATNSLGTALGALIAFFYGEPLFRSLTHWQGRLVADRPHAEPGVVLLGLWLLTQVTPETLLFGAGDVRHLVGLPSDQPFAPQVFQVVEAAIVGINLVAVGLFARTLLADRWPALVGVPLLIVTALGVRSLATAVLVGPDDAFAWFTPGSRLGLEWGAAALLVLVWLPADMRISLASLGLMAATVLINLAPENPYSAAALAAWRQGHFFNFNGVTRITASLWPFAAVPYLMLVARRI